jgi:hypothetical protein
VQAGRDARYPDDGTREDESGRDEEHGRASMRSRRSFHRPVPSSISLLTGSGGAEGWLDIGRTGITVCKDDQGLDVDLAVEADCAQMHRWLIGLVPFRDLVAAGQVRLLGPSRLAGAFPTWFDTRFFAEGLRKAEQRNRRQTTAPIPAWPRLTGARVRRHEPPRLAR